MKKIFSTFNRENDLKFQTETSIFIENGKKFVMKKPLTIEAEEHIRNIYSNYILLKEKYANIENVKVVESKIIENVIIFEFADGTSLDKQFLQMIIKRDKEGFWKLLEKYISFIKNLSPTAKASFEISKEMEPIFGNFKINNVECSNTFNIDFIFDNIFVDENNNYSIIDYEWGFPQAFPINYLVFRTICNIFFKYPELLNNFITKEEICNFVGINPDEQEIYWQMEMNFQNYVLGKGHRYVIKEQYNKKVNLIQTAEGNLRKKKKLLSFKIGKKKKLALYKEYNN